MAYKNVITCSECNHFFINPEGISMCNSEKGIAFPTGADYCSYAEPAENGSTREVNNSELLRLVYEQRRSQ